jgi:lipopolysaccharide export system permease protein
VLSRLTLMTTIDRYILKELIKVFTLSVTALTAILFLDKTLFLTELIINKGVEFTEVCLMMLYISPAFLALTIPMSVMVAAVVAFSQFSADSELVAMKASGFSFLRLMRPIFVFSVAAYIATNFIMFYALPWGNQSFKQIIYDILQNRINFDIKENVFNKDFDNLVILIENKENDHHLKKIFIADSTQTQTPKVILAEDGKIVSDPQTLRIQLNLTNGTIHELSQKGSHYQILNFDRYDLTLALPKSQDLQRKAMKGNRELSFTELRNKINRLKAEGSKTNYEEVELSKKFSLPFTCLLFGFIGAPLGVKSSRSGKSGSFSISAVAILIYYVGLISTQNLGSLGKINPLISVWIPNLIALVVAYYLVSKMHKEIPFRFLNHIEDFFFIVFQKIKALYIANFQPLPSRSNPAKVVGKRQKKIDQTTRGILKGKIAKLDSDKILQ